MTAGDRPPAAGLRSPLDEQAQREAALVLARFRYGGGAFQRHGIELESLGDLIGALHGLADVYEALDGP